jgi:hypothetical protein
MILFIMNVTWLICILEACFICNDMQAEVLIIIQMHFLCDSATADRNKYIL